MHCERRGHFARCRTYFALRKSELSVDVKSCLDAIFSEQRWHRCFSRPMKKIQTVSFIKSAVKPEQYPSHNLPEIAFIGRSNVGKSSLLNTLVNKKNLARISKYSRTNQLINFFNVDEKLCFVDLPGYGYAKVPESVRKQWKPMIAIVSHAEPAVKRRRTHC